MRIAELLINWRFFKKVNIREASAIIGISPSSLSRIERGKMPDGETLMLLMNWLFTAEPQEAHEEIQTEEVSTDAGN